MNLRYVLGLILTIPLLPIMYFQGKRVKAAVPVLPEATGLNGVSNSKESKALRLITIGESTIAGVGVKTHEEGFTGTLANEIAQRLNVKVPWKVYAKKGFTAKRVLSNIIPTIQEKKADLIIIGLGANDAFTLNSPTKWARQVKELIQTLKSKFPEVPIVFINMPPIKEFPAFTKILKFTMGNLVEIFGTELEKVTKEFDQVFFYSRKLSLQDWVDRLNIKGNKSDFFSDGVHPSKLTYQTWAKDFASFMLNNEGLQLQLRK